MTQTITRSYDSYATASALVERLKAAGVEDDHISLIAKGEDGEAEAQTEGNAPEGAGIGAGVGGAAGLLTGLGIMAIPGVGPVVAAGWLATTALGAAAGAGVGGLIGALTGSGVSNEDAQVYAETVRRGGAVVSVKADDDEVATVESVLGGTTHIDPAIRRGEYQREGWTRFDETAEPYKRPLV